MARHRPRHNWRQAYHESFATFRDQYRDLRRTNSPMRMFTADGEYKRVCELTDAEIDAIAWREAEQASDQAINKHNASVAAMKRKSGEAQ